MNYFTKSGDGRGRVEPQLLSADCITLAHGGGGQLTDELVQQVILPRVGNEILEELLDSAELDVPAGCRLAMTIDGYVVTPWEFPGGDIGRLAVSGTVNDIAVTGADPVAIALSLILGEGFSKRSLGRVMDSIAAAAKEAGVRVVTGDTKVVGRGHAGGEADGIFVVTAGVGFRSRERARLHPGEVREGDVLIINGPIADHGMAVMLAREMPHVKSVVKSDSAPLNGLVKALLNAVPETRFLRDATRAGLSGLCADLAERTRLHVCLEESAIPVRSQTLHIAEMLGIDPLDVANEGKLVAVVPAETAEAALEAMRAHPRGSESVIIGSMANPASPATAGLCSMRTRLGGRRIIQKPYGEQLPRIC